MLDSQKTYKITNLLPQFLNDVPEIIRAFQPYIKISDDGDDLILKFSYVEAQDYHVFELLIDNQVVKLDVLLKLDDINLLDAKSRSKKLIKNFLYQYFSKRLGVKLEYGSLTGVRPLSIAYRQQIPKDEVEDYLIKNFFVSKRKAKLINDVHTNQIGFYNPSDNKIDLFVNIPICKTKCKYCSFPTEILTKASDILEMYIKCVLSEIELKKELLTNHEIENIYVGGGTPTCIPDFLLERLLKELSTLIVKGHEFTIEAGRPDSISLENLNLMANYNVSRVSVNPQTFKEETLISIGRNHDSQSIYDAYYLAKLFPFDINMDLIAGLPGEKIDDFMFSLDKVIELSPANITVHSLSIKKGSALMEVNSKKDVSGLVSEMVDYSQFKLYKNGYIPYYMYRQKNTFDNLENVGYCKPGKQCRYNINYMEETNTVIGIGAGAMSKFVFNDINRIERTRNKKNIELYIKDILSCTQGY